MAQDTDVWESETSTQTERTDERKSMESATGRDKPSGDGGVGDEQVNAVERANNASIGQDHSTERTDREDADGVGAIQDSSDTTTGAAQRG